MNFTNNTNIAYLAWGSLIFSSDTLKIKEWKQSNLKLPIEFSRISDNKIGRLTLVIDELNGLDNNIWYAYLQTSNINKAIKDLKIREKTIKNSIGYINKKSNKMRIGNLSDKIVKNIIDWMNEMNIDVAIWTNLQSNFTDYSNENAYNYYIGSNEKTRQDIYDYIINCLEKCLIKTSFSDYFSIKHNK
jgi:hypothetical protein